MRSPVEFRRQLRQELTPAECVLWGALRAKRFNHLKFRRQHSIGRFVVDFYCASARLVIELDGASHADIGSQQYDYARDSWLRDKGYIIIRFENRDVFEQLEAILDTIQAATFK